MSVRFEDEIMTENGNDISIVDDGDNDEEEDDSGEFNFAAALALRKNLTETFEKHAREEKGGSISNSKPGGTRAGYSSDNVSTNSVLAKIAELERARNDGGGALPRPQQRQMQHHHQQASCMRPPMAPTSFPGQLSKADSATRREEKRGSLLSVYLRIRPPVAPAKSTSDPSILASSAANTIEILDPTEDENDQEMSTVATATTRPTTVRTYPPINSNTAKVVRGGSHKVSLSNLDNGSGTTSSSEGGVGSRGVKDFDFNEVFGPGVSQEVVYNGVASQMVEGLFPSRKPNDSNMGDAGKVTMGKSALLFAYGITNAGKTHTIMGDCVGGSGQIGGEEVHENWGIMPRALHDIFRRVGDLSTTGAGQQSQIQYELNLSYLEIYNEQVFDLLPPQESTQKGTNACTSGQGGGGGSSALRHHSFGSAVKAPLKLREGRDGQIFVHGLTKHTLKNVSQGLELAALAKGKRHTSSNNLNSDSSRSHCICQLELVAKPAKSRQSAESMDDNDSAAGTVSLNSSGQDTGDQEDSSSTTSEKTKKKDSVSMWIVDLAGSERSKRTGVVNRSARQKEAALINSSLMKLMRCIHVMQQNQKHPGSINSIANGNSNGSSIVPFRESKLTHLFMNHLAGSSASRTSMVVNVNPAAVDFDETQHVLAYATVARSVKITEVEYSRKRRAIAMSGASAGTDRMTHTHGDDGRPISRNISVAGKRNNFDKSPPKKIVRLARRLSPRMVLAKRREQQANAQKRKAELQNMRGAMPGTSSSTSGKNKVAGPSKKVQKFHIGGSVKRTEHLREKEEITRKHEEELGLLRTALSNAEKESSALKSKNLELREELSQREAEVRMEVAEEMASQMKAMREQYNNIVDRLKMQVNANPTPGKSARKAKIDKAEQLIEELMDKVDECEEEMVRMREVHEDELSKMAKVHKEIVSAKDAEILEFKKIQQEALAVAESETQKWKEEVDGCHDRIKELQQHNTEILAAYQELQEEEAEMIESDRTKEAGQRIMKLHQHNSSRVEGEQESCCNENADKSPRVRRLPRGRCSEVACGFGSPKKDLTPASSSKKKRGGMRFLRAKVASNEKGYGGRDPSRAPLTSMSPSTANNVPRTNSNEDKEPAKDSNHEKEELSDEDERSDGDEMLLLYPPNPAEQDENTGLWQRPRGRAPSGRCWDDEVGAWRLEETA